MKRILTAAVFASAVAGVAYAGDVIGRFNSTTNGDNDGQRASHYSPNYGQPAPKPAKPTKYDEELFDGANGAPVYRRDEKGYTGEPDAEIASAQCDWALNGTNAASFGKCPKERGAERVLDKDGTNYSSPVRLTRTVPGHGDDIWHADQGSGQ